jgi:hypothetical protein
MGTGKPKGRATFTPSKQRARPKSKRQVVKMLRSKTYHEAQRYEIFEMSRSGMNNIEIARELSRRGITLSDQYIRQIIWETLTKIKTNSLDLIEEVRVMQLSSLDAALVEVNNIIYGSRKVSKDTKLAAIDRLIRINHEKSTLLGTLKEPEKQIKVQHEQIVRIYEGLTREDLSVTFEMEPKNAIVSGDDLLLEGGDVVSTLDHTTSNGDGGIES